MKKILVLSPHTDDAEFGCGGSIARWIDDGNEIYCVAFSCGNAHRKEFFAAMDCLHIEDAAVNVFETRCFIKARQDILDCLISIRDDFNPDTVLIPSSGDIHQDHQVIHQEAIRAFKHCTILGYELPWNSLVTDSTMLVSITEDQLDSKLNAIACYESQAEKAYADPNFIEGLARVRGVQAGTCYAEGFEVVRQIW